MKNRAYLFIAVWLAWASPAWPQTWSATPASGDWNTAVNWNPTVVPNSQSAHVTLNPSSVTQLSLSADTDVADILENPGAYGYSLDCGSHDLNFWGGGINNQGGSSISIRGSGEIGFHNNSNAYSAVIIVESGGRLSFSDFSTASHRTVVNNGAAFDISGIAGSGFSASGLEGDGDFYLGSKSLTISGGSFTITGNIMDGGLSGGTGASLFVYGSLALSGTNLYSGGTTIAYFGRLSVGAPDALGLGQVYNEGTLETCGGPVSVNIRGDYTGYSSSTLRLGLGGTGPGQYDRLAITGQAWLGSDLELFSYGGFAPQVGDTFTLLTASKIISTFSSPLANPFDGVRIRLRYLTDEVQLQAIPESFEVYAMTPNQIALARALDENYEEKSADTLITKIIALPLSEYPAAFRAAAPEELTALYRIVFTGLDALYDDIDGRLSALRHGAAAREPVRYMSGGTGGMGTLFSNWAGPKNLEDWGGYITASGAAAKVKGDDDAAGYDFTTGNLTMAGVNYRVGKDLLGGGFLGYSRTDANLEQGGHITVNGARFGFFGTYYSSSGFHADFVAIGGWDFYDTLRDGLGEMVSNHSDGMPFLYSLGCGYDVQAGDFTFKTGGRFRFSAMEIFTMTEAGQSNSTVLITQGENSLSSELGLKTVWNIGLGGAELAPRVGAAWRHEYFVDRDRLKVSFTNSQKDFYQVQGPEIGRDALDLIAGLNLNFSERFFVFAEYRAELGRMNFESEGLACGASFAF